MAEGKNTREPKCVNIDRRIIEERLQQVMQRLEHRKTPQTDGFQPQTQRREQWTVDPFWEIDRSQQPEQEQSGTLQQNYTPMEEGENVSETDQDPSVLEVPAMNSAKYVGVKNVQYIKMGHAPRVNAEEPNNWDLGNAVRHGKEFLHRSAASTDGNHK